MSSGTSLTTGQLGPAAPSSARVDEADAQEANLGHLYQYITFRVAEEEYGVDIMSVREIKAWTETTLVPNTPDYMRGVLNLRGTIVPIFDLKCRFGLELTDITTTSVVIIVQVEERVIGLLVDAVSDILDAYESHIRAVPRLDRTIHEEYLVGLVTVERRMVALLDPSQLFPERALPSEVAVQGELAP